MQRHLALRVVENPLAFYTLTRTLESRTFTGPLDKPLLVATTKADSGPNPENGRRIYRTFCVVCHQADGKGGALPGSPAASQATLVAANFTLRGKDAPLSKADADLIKIITEGAPGKPMPPFGGVLKQEEIRDVLAYLRAAFGAERSSNPSNP